MNTILTPLSQADAQFEWPLAEEYLTRASTDADPVNFMRGVQARVFAGLTLLWKIHDEDGIAVAYAISVMYTVDGISNVCQLSLGTADDLKHFTDHNDEFTAWAIRNNVEFIEVIGRKGWEKILKPLGFTHNHTSLMRRISEELH